MREHDNWLTLYSAASLNFSGEIQTQQLAHCNVEALRLNASWAANWDLDEWLLVESRDRSWRRALGDRMAGLPAELRALQINRVEFGAPQTLELPPLHLLEPEVQTIEIYAHKRGKTMWRPDPSLEHSTRGGHRLYRQHWAERALPWSSCTGSTGVMHLSANASCTLALELLPRLRIQHFSHRSRSECLRKVELFQLFYVAAKQNAMVRYNVSAQDGCDWRRTYPDHKYANKSLNASLEDVRAFISHTFAQGLGVLDREQRQFREGLDAYMHGGSPDFTLAEIAGRTHTSPSSMPMRRGAIAPGLRISEQALFEQTAKLPRVEVAQPPKAIGTNTRHAMQSGLFYGYAGLVDSLARRCRDELGDGARVVATGGLARLVCEECTYVDEVEPYLTLRGLALLHALNTG